MKQAMGGWNPNKFKREGFVRENMSPEKPENAQVMFSMWSKTFVSQASTLLKPMIISHGFGPGMYCIFSWDETHLICKNMKLKKK